MIIKITLEKALDNLQLPPTLNIKRSKSSTVTVTSQFLAIFLGATHILITEIKKNLNRDMTKIEIKQQ